MGGKRQSAKWVNQSVQAESAKRQDGGDCLD